MAGQAPRPQDGGGHDQPEPRQPAVEVEIEPGLPRHSRGGHRRPVAGALDHVEPQVLGLVLVLVLIRIVDQMRAAPGQRDFAGQDLVGALKQGIDRGEMRLPRIGVIGKRRIALLWQA